MSVRILLQVTTQYARASFCMRKVNCDRAVCVFHTYLALARLFACSRLVDALLCLACG